MNHHDHSVAGHLHWRQALGAALLAALGLVGAGTARAESDPAQMNAHLQVFAFAPSKPGAEGATRAVPPAAAEPARAQRSAGLGYDSGKRNGVHGLIARHAAAQGIPVALADAVVRIESRYNPAARNAGAVGLMQIKPQTARGLGYQGGAAGLMQPETNVKYGMIYLAQAYRMSGGDTCATLMRYQSGHYATRANRANRAYCAKARTIMASN